MISWLQNLWIKQKPHLQLYTLSGGKITKADEECSEKCGSAFITFFSNNDLQLEATPCIEVVTRMHHTNTFK